MTQRDRKSLSHLYRLSGASISFLLSSCALLPFSEEKSDIPDPNLDPVAFAAYQIRAQREPASFGTHGLPPGLPTQAAAPEHYREQIREGLHTGDLVLGMSMDQVRRAWGTPMAVERVGTSTDGTARWSYPEGMSQSEGVSPLRWVYFEKGHVVGWETASR